MLRAPADFETLASRVPRQSIAAAWRRRGYGWRPLSVRASGCRDPKGFRDVEGGGQLGAAGASGAARGAVRWRLRAAGHRHRRERAVVARQQRAHRGGAPRRRRDPG